MTGPARDYDHLADEYRWCVYCKADCWPEPENQQHQPDCASITGLYPVMPTDLNPWGGYGDCSACHTPFALGDLYVIANMDTETVDGSRSGYVVCVGCGSVAAPIG